MTSTARIYVLTELFLCR